MFFLNRSNLLVDICLQILFFTHGLAKKKLENNNDVLLYAKFHVLVCKITSSRPLLPRRCNPEKYFLKYYYIYKIGRNNKQRLL